MEFSQDNYEILENVPWFGGLWTEIINVSDLFFCLISREVSGKSDCAWRSNKARNDQLKIENRESGKVW
jgi:hypothetical protein